MIEVSKRLASISNYAFAEIKNKVAALKEKGVNVIDFGVGDPSEPTPEIVRNAIKLGVDVRAASGYPNYEGSIEYRAATAKWVEKRFGVKLDPETEVSVSVGSKEAIFNFHEAFVNPGDYVIVPNPGYPPYARGALFAEGKVHYVNLKAENNFLPDLSSIPNEVLKKSKIIWINYPNNPTGVIAPRKFYEEMVAFGKKHNIVIASDEAYSENYANERPHSILEFAREGVVAFNSLSKRSRMTGYRVGFVAGDKDLISTFKKLKTNIDSGTPTFVQDAAIAAFSDEKHVEEFRSLYAKKRGLITSALVKAGLEKNTSEATIYIWQKVPKGLTSVEFAEKLLAPEIAIVTTPGSWISEPTPEGNPGDGYVRFSLSCPIEECEEAAERIGRHL